MRRLLLAALGGTAAFAAAVWMGAAAATTGAPVFYDARYPVPATNASEQYVADSGDAGDPATGRPGAADQSDDAVASPDAPRTAAPTPQAPAAPPTGAPRATPSPGDKGRADVDSEPSPGAGRGAPDAAEQERWIAFQQVVLECMAGAGQEYVYWEWWTPGAGAPDRRSAMPDGLSPDEQAAWALALDGTARGGDGYRWQDAGCWGYAVHVTGGTD